MKALLVAVLVLAFAGTAQAETRIGDGPARLTNDSRPVFSLSGTAPLECRMDQLAWQPCADGVFSSPVLADGSHVLRVRSTTDGTSAFHSFTTDTSAPDATLDGPDTVTDVTATLTFSSPEDGVEFKCAIDSGDAAPCTSPYTTPVPANGTHAVTVVASDPAGNQTVRTKVLSVQATGPETTIDGPEGATKDRKPTFALASSRPGSTFECKVDDAAWAACEAAYQSPELMPGAHTIYARAKDAAGNVDATPAARLEVRDCTEKLTIGVVEAVADCFYKQDGVWVAEDSVKVNGITFNKLDGRKLRFDTEKRKLSLGKVQLRIKGIVLYQGDLEWTVPAGDQVTLAKFDVGTKTKADAKPKDSEAALDLKGDDGANVQGFELTGEAKLSFFKGGVAVLSANVELPKVFQDAEGNGLTGAVQVKSDNEHGIYLSGLQITARWCSSTRSDPQPLSQLRGRAQRRFQVHLQPPVAGAALGGRRREDRPADPEQARDRQRWLRLRRREVQPRRRDHEQHAGRGHRQRREGPEDRDQRLCRPARHRRRPHRLHRAGHRQEQDQPEGPGRRPGVQGRGPVVAARRGAAWPPSPATATTPSRTSTCSTPPTARSTSAAS